MPGEWHAMTDQQMDPLDVVIRAGAVYRGNNESIGDATDVGVRGGRVCAIGDLSNADTRKSLDASGAVVAPGFIDSHTHSDAAPFMGQERSNVKAASLVQGVCTEVTGNCGFSLFPALDEELALRALRPILGSDARTFRSLKELSAALSEADLLTNVAPLVGHSMLRLCIAGYTDRSLTTKESTRMAKLLAEAFDDGAFGVSTGLIYPPAAFAPKSELFVLGRVAAEYDRPLTIHIRDEMGDVAAALEEALEIARECGCAVHVSHHKVGGPENWGRSVMTLALLENARREGLDITCDVYPYTRGSTFLFAMVPPWVSDGDEQAVLRRLADRRSRQTMDRDIRAGLAGWENTVGKLGWSKIILSSCPQHPELPGSAISEVASTQNKSEIDFVCDLLLEEPGEVTVLTCSMREDDVRRVLSDPSAMVGSDGILGSGLPHPRWAGSFARVLGKYCRDEGLFSVGDAVNKLSSMAAARFNLRERGALKEGAHADIVVFDASQVNDGATWLNPLQEPTGIRHVLVNGEAAVIDGVRTGRAGGAVLCPSK